MKALLIKLLTLALCKLHGGQMFICPVKADVLAAAEEGVKKFIDRGPSGEFRRHQVLSTMLKQKPGLRQRDAAVAIEMALRRVSP